MTDSPHSQKIPTCAVPTTDDECIDWLRLTRSHRVGPVTFIRLIREHGSAKAALAALPDVAAASGAKQYLPYAQADAEAELQKASDAGARMLVLGTPEYPAMLATIQDPPPLIWTLGALNLNEKPMVALVGARSSSSVGRRMAARLAAGLAEAGIVVVSGLARGIDAEAHNAALRGGTVAVQAGGVDDIYPAENGELATRILENGLRVSEMPMGLRPQARHFPRRNRMISGMSQVVVVVEGAARSGSLITAKNALDQGREVMAVPGNPIDGRSTGCNLLIRDGAKLVQSVDDIIEELQKDIEPANPKIIETKMRNPEGLSTEILSLLSTTPIAEDILIRHVQGPASDVLTTLSILELEGEVVRQDGGLVLTSA